MRFLIILLLIVFPFGQLLRFDMGSGVTIHLNDIVVAAIGGLGIFGVIKKYPFWVGVMILSLVVNAGHYRTTELAVASLYIIRWVAYAGLYFVFKEFPKAEKDLVKNGLLIDVLIIAVVGIGQFIFLPDVSFLAASNWDGHYYRLISTFLDPGFTGAILVFGIIILFFLQSPAIALVYLALMLTFSRASYLMFLGTFAVVAWAKKSVRIFLIAFIVLLVTIPFLPKSTGEGTKLARENSIEARITNWRESIAIWERSPIFGVGYDAYRYVRGEKPESHSGAGADSSLLLVLATTGVVGLAVYLGVLREMWVVGRKSILFRASFLAVIVHSFFNNTLFYPWVMEWLWILLTIA